MKAANAGAPRHLPERDHDRHRPGRGRGPRVRDRTGLGADRIRFSSALLPPYARRSKSLEVLIPILYLKDLHRRLHRGAGGLTRAGRRRPLGLVHRAAWAGEHAHWLKRDLSARRYVYFWADGIPVHPARGRRAMPVGHHRRDARARRTRRPHRRRAESTQSWRELLLDLSGAGSRWPGTRGRRRPLGF